MAGPEDAKDATDLRQAELFSIGRHREELLYSCAP